MDSLTLAIAIACVTSVCAAIIGMLFVYERNEGDRLAEENAKLRAALETKRTEAGTLSDEVSRLARQIKEQSETIASREREIKDFHKRGYIRNAYGTLQRYADWLENGDKKPKPKRTTAQKIKDVGDHFIAETAKIKEKKRDETGRKPHQLRYWHQVLGATSKQFDQVLSAAKEYGVPFNEVELTDRRHKNICFTDEIGASTGEYPKDINIPFKEFMARIRGVWVEQ